MREIRTSPILQLVLVLVLGGCGPSTSGGGVAGDAIGTYVSYRRAIEAGDLKALRGLVTAGRVGELEAADAAEKVRMIQEMAPPTPTLVDSEVADGRAHLWLRSAVEGQRLDGEVELAREDGRWKVDRETWTMTIAPPESAATPFTLDLTQAKPELTLTGHHGATYVVFTPDGQTVVSAGYGDRTLRSWHAGDGRERSLAQAPGRPTSLVALPDGSGVLSGGMGGQVLFWPLVHGRLGESELLIQGVGNHAQLAVSPDGRLVASTGWQTPAYLWDRETGRQLHQLVTSEGQRGLAFGPRGDQLATGGYGDTLSVWNVQSGRGRTLSVSEVTSKSDASAIAFSPDGRWLATGHMDSSITIWEVPDLEQRQGFRVPNASTYTLAFSPDGRFLVSGQQGGKIWLWDPASGQPRHALMRHQSSVTSLAFSDDAMASADERGNVIVWR